jgi:hypothetical protein
MKLPSGEQAIIDPRKVTDYCLSPEHEDGQDKARLFASLLGLTIDHADLLLDALCRAATTGEAVLGKQDPYGQRFVIDFAFARPGGSAVIRSAWIIRENETVPRLVTYYIL